MTPRLTAAQIAEFNEKGYLIRPSFFDAEEIALLHEIALADKNMEKAGGPVDAGGRASRLHLRNDLPDDIYSACVRARRMVETLEQLLGGEVYHYHHKMMLKEPRVGGAWEWHQDFGYWYQQYLTPAMGSAMIAVDRATKANGCLQVIPGSHRCGRIEHQQVGQQTGANPERVQAVLRHLPLVHVELEPGDTLFFHSNLLHSSDRNESENPRWTLICCYNTRSNPMMQNKDRWHPAYSYLNRLEDEEVRRVGLRQIEELHALPALS